MSQYVRPGTQPTPPQTDVIQITAPVPGDYVADIIYVPTAGTGGGGGGGTQVVAYHHKQQSSSAVWTITHNLNFYPNVTTMDSGGSIVEGELEHLSRNTLRVTFLAAFSGDAYLS